MADFTLQALKDEITADSLNIYPPFTAANDAAIAVVINNQDGANPRTANRESVDTGAIRGSITFDAFDGLTAAESDWFAWLTANGVIPVTDDTLQQLAGTPTANASIWAVSDRTASNAAMVALMQFQGSRAQELWGENTSVSPSDVAAARNLP